MAGGLEITVDGSDAIQASKWFKQLRRHQIPFATSKALNNTIFDARDAIRGQAFSKFKLKNKGLPTAAVKATTTHKRDWPNLRAVTYVPPKFAFLELQETGGVKRAKGGGSIAVPTRLPKRKASGGVVKPQSPRRIAARKTSFRDGNQLIHRTKKRRFGIYYLFHKKANITKAFAFESTGRRTIKRVWPAHFRKHYTNSLKPPTRRRK